MKFVNIKLSEIKYFELGIGKRVLKKTVYKVQSGIPVYSANVRTVFGYAEKSNIKKFDTPYVLWGIDSYFEFNIMSKGVEFATTDHCGSISVKDKNILPEYIAYQLNRVKSEHSFDRSWRPSLKNMSKVSIKIPIIPTDHNLKTCEGYQFDLEEQTKLAKKFKLLQKVKGKLQLLEEEIKQLESVADSVVLD
ncbi:MAG: restriction endonuclease subunit S [Nitrosopumilus sp.]|uniref:restriction endonuclease subunit S n=1 Tax=Nitrosopumilus sp. TaxID=2024843 RepID=UPI00242A5724|nr:restriction endonuclease subunit S [Nitrosopumilus sp.]MCV0366323.1 restriction endonuclease subunit S [Nitrosopumilus sp.]